MFGDVEESSLHQATVGLAVETREQPEENGQYDAYQDAHAEREEDGDMFSLVDNVARQSLQRQADSSRQQQQGSDDSEQEPETKKRFTEFNHLQPFANLS
jgi:hypothetical protein